MKRSRHLALLLMGATPFLLAGCDDADDSTEEFNEAAYADRAQCITDGNSAADCEKAFVAAENSAAKEHPKFATREECEKQFSAEDCTEMVNGEERHWAPHTHGILWRRSLYSSGGGVDAPAVESHPLYRSSSGGLVETAVVAGAAGYAASKYAQHTSSPVTATAHAQTVTRGGFGHTSSSHSSSSHSSSGSHSSHSSGHSSGS